MQPQDDVRILLGGDVRGEGRVPDNFHQTVQQDPQRLLHADVDQEPQSQGRWVRGVLRGEEPKTDELMAGTGNILRLKQQ